MILMFSVMIVECACVLMTSIYTVLGIILKLY